MTRTTNTGRGRPGVARSMRFSHEKAEGLVRGWWFDTSISKADMSQHLGVSKAWLERLVNRWGLPDRRSAAFKSRMPVRVRGQVFADAAACAAHFGVHINTVRTMVCRGHADRIGLGNARAEATRRTKSQPLVVGPFRWESHRLAASALGFTPSKLSLLKREGRTDEIVARAMMAQVRIERAAA